MVDSKLPGAGVCSNVNLSTFDEHSNFRDSPNDTACKPIENRSSKDVVDDPLIPCYFLPRQFLQCNEPVGRHHHHPIVKLSL